MKRILFLMLTLMVTSMTVKGQTNVTSLIKNFSFENGMSNWNNDGFQVQNNSDFTLKSGEWYAEKWTPSGGSVDDAQLSQTISGMKAGTYTLTVRSQNIQQGNTTQICSGVEVFLGDSSTPVNTAKSYTVTFTSVCSSADVGIRIKSATGNWIAVDHFQLSYTFDQEAVSTRLQSLISEGEQMMSDYHLDGSVADLLTSAINAAKHEIGSDDAESITSAGDQLRTAMWEYRLATASYENPIDFTSYIINPNFEKGLEGWSTSTFQVQNNNAFSQKSLSNYAERWVPRGKQIGSASLSQIVNSLPKGRYLLKVNAQHLNEDNPAVPQSGVTLTAEAGITEITVAKEYTLEFVSIENSLPIGIYGESASGNWLACDNFRLYFIGYGQDIIDEEMSRRISEAKSLLDEHMNQSAYNTLQTYTTQAEQSSESDFSENAALLRIAISSARKSASAFSQLLSNITICKSMLEQDWANGKDDLRDAIELAEAIYNDLTSSVSEVNEQSRRLEGCMLELRLANGSGVAPTVVTDHRYARGNNRIFARMSSSGSNIIEEGFCYSTSSLPTVADKRATRWIDSGGRIYVIDDLTPGTVYYIRAYAITSTDNVGYGDVVKAVTLPPSNIRWSYENNGNAEENARINAGMSGWYEYWSQLTSINGYYPSVRIASGTPTADCSYGGWCQVGTNAGFQQQATLTHEMLHGIGVGTHNVWWGAGGMRANGDRGVWLGDRVTEVLTFWHNAYTVLDGDNTHMWPWGFNYASEDPHTEGGYSINAMVAQALGEDGLPPTNGFPTAYYAFEQEDNRKYYLTNEEINHGLGTALLGVSSNGSLRWITSDAGQALENDSLAWYISFNAPAHRYSFRNAATGKYIVYDGVFRLQQSDNVPATGYFQLMKGRVDATIVNANGNHTARGYWIVHSENQYASPCLAAIESGSVRSEGFDLGNWAVTQRWLILNTDEMRRLAPSAEQSYEIISSLKVNNEPLAEFQSDRYEYDYEIDPSSTITRYSIGFTKTPDFDGTIHTTRPKTIPGDGYAEATAADGTVTTYTIHFFKNHAIHWDGDGIKGAGSEPYRFGWGPRLRTSWSMSNSSLTNAYLDPYEGTHVGYVTSDGNYKYNHRRLLPLSYESGSEEYTYTFSTLEPDSGYRYSCLISHSGGNRPPQVTIGIRLKSTGEVLAEETFTPSSVTKQLKEISFNFKTPEETCDTTAYTIYYKLNRTNCQLVLGDLVVTPIDLSATSIGSVEEEISELNVRVLSSGIEISSSQTSEVIIYNLSGMKVKQVHLEPGIPRIVSLHQGIYIINGEKYIVR